MSYLFRLCSKRKKYLPRKYIIAGILYMLRDFSEDKLFQAAWWFQRAPCSLKLHWLPTPTTKEGKNNGYRQTNARTVYIIKYINFFDGPVHTVTLKRYRFKTRFYVTKIPVQRLDGWYFFCNIFWEKRAEKWQKTGQISFFVFLGPKMGVVTGIFWGFRHGGKLRRIFFDGQIYR